MEKFTGRFVNTSNFDDIRLSGLLAKRDNSNTIVIHLHGMQGNLFQNRFVKKMFSKYPERGFSFITVPQRGSEVVKGAEHDFRGFEKEIIEWAQK